MFFSREERWRLTGEGCTLPWWPGCTLFSQPPHPHPHTPTHPFRLSVELIMKLIKSPDFGVTEWNVNVQNRFMVLLHCKVQKEDRTAWDAPHAPAARLCLMLFTSKAIFPPLHKKTKDVYVFFLVVHCFLIVYTFSFYMYKGFHIFVAFMHI